MDARLWASFKTSHGRDGPHFGPREVLKQALRAVTALVCLFTCAFADAAAQEGIEVSCLRIGAGQASGRLLAIEDGDFVFAAPGGVDRIPIENLRRLEVRGARQVNAEFRFKVWGPFREQYLATELESARGGGDALQLRGSGWTVEGFDLRRLRAIACAEFLKTASLDERKRFEETRTGQLDADLVMVLTDGRRDLLGGAVTSLSGDGVRVKLAGVERSLPWARAQWIVMAPNAARQAAPPHLVQLCDGTRVRADTLELKDGRLRAKAGEMAIEAGVEALSRVDIGSPRCRYLEDMEPANIRVEPFADVVWKPRAGLCVSGKPIVLGGRTFEHGLGTHTRTQMTYSPAGGWTHFYATTGVDDSAQDRGRVVFRVLLDGREAFKSEAMGGGAPAAEVAVPLKGARELTIISDFGSDVRADGNLADWADARLVREP